MKEQNYTITKHKQTVGARRDEMRITSNFQPPYDSAHLPVGGKSARVPKERLPDEIF